MPRSKVVREQNQRAGGGDLRRSGGLCLESNGEDDPGEEQIFRDLWEDETQREVVIESFKADCEVRTERPPGSLRYDRGSDFCAEG